jgi:hypothetical protein
LETPVHRGHKEAWDHKAKQGLLVDHKVAQVQQDHEDQQDRKVVEEQVQQDHEDQRDRKDQLVLPVDRRAIQV